MIAVDTFTEALRLVVYIVAICGLAVIGIVVAVALSGAPRRSPESPNGCERECEQCEGHGTFVVLFSYGPVEYDCDHCDGRGHYVARHCQKCEPRS